MSDLWYPRARNLARTGAFSRRRVLGGASLTAAGLASMAFAGCGSDEENDPSPTTAPSGGTQPTTATAPSATPSEESYPEEFVFAGEREPADLMPFFGGFDQAVILRAINQTFVHVKMTDPSGTGQAQVSYEGILAKSWENPEPTTWIFKLRPGVKFHDGTDWDAEAAKMNLEIYADTPALQAMGKTALLGRYMKSAEAIDATTLKIEANSPLVEQEFFGFAFYLGFAASSPRALAAGGVEALRESPVGTGPYRFDQWRKGQDLTLVRNEDYWGDLPNMRKMKFIWRPEASVRAQTIKAGEAHFAYSIGSEQASGLENSVVGGGFQSNTLRLNNTKAPTQDIRVRRAINFALDRDGINEAIFKGSATPIGFFAYQPVHVPIWKYDPAEAKSLLSAAGAEGAQVELVYGEGRVPEEDQLAEIYKSQLEAIGLAVKLSKVERAQYNEISAATFDQQPEILMETTSSGNYGEIAGSLLDKYGCEGSGTFCNPAWDARFTALQSLGGAERLSEVEKISVDLQEEETPRAWVLAINQVHGLANNVQTEMPLNVTIHVQDLGFA